MILKRVLHLQDVSEAEKRDSSIVDRFFARAIRLRADLGRGSLKEIDTAFSALHANCDVSELAQQLRVAAFFARIKKSVTVRLRSEKLHLTSCDTVDFLGPLPRVDACKQAEARGSFPSLLRNDPMMELGDVRGCHVTGVIVEAVDNDLYVDFGGKFLCVVRRPPSNSEIYVRGLSVVLELENLEQVQTFMSSDTPVTLREAKGHLIRRLDPAELKTEIDDKTETK